MKEIFKKIKEQSSQFPYKLFGLFGLVNYPLFYFFWKIMPDSRYDDIFLRIVSTLLCLGLFLNERWPDKLKSFLILYWYLTITFCLPFMGTYLFLENNASSSWMLNSTLGIFLMLFVLDWISFTIILPCGVGLGVLAYYITGKEFIISEANFLSTIANISWVVIVALLFSRKKDLIRKEKEIVLNLTAGAIAHEMRTPLANVKMNAKSLEKIAARIQQGIGQDVSKKDQLLSEQGQELIHLSHRLTRIAQGSQNFINLLLGNLRQDFKEIPLSPLSMQASLHKIFEEFAFKPHQKEKVHLIVEQDFQFKGNEELVTHIFFNLLKNSLYFIHAAGKGDIYITIRQRHTENQVEFKDTGPGIEAHRIPHLFKPFYSRRPHGTGIGLSFCKKAIESIGGQIEVTSELKKHTTFTLRLPQLSDYCIK